MSKLTSLQEFLVDFTLVLVWINMAMFPAHWDSCVVLTAHVFQVHSCFGIHWATQCSQKAQSFNWWIFNRERRRWVKSTGVDTKPGISNVLFSSLWLWPCPLYEPGYILSIKQRKLYLNIINVFFLVFQEVSEYSIVKSFMCPGFLWRNVTWLPWPRIQKAL